MSDIPSKGAGSLSVHMALLCESEQDLYSRMSNLSSRKKTLKNSGLIRRASTPETDQDSWPSWLPLVSWSFLTRDSPPLLVPFSSYWQGDMGLTPRRLIRTLDQEGYSLYHSILFPQRRASLLVPLPLDSRASRCQNSAHHFLKVFSVWYNCLELKCKTINQSKELIKGYLIKMCTFLILSAAAWGCLITGGNSVRNPFNWLWILGLIVRAPYSNFGEACQHGTMLWPSTYKDGITNNLVNIVGYISLTHATSFL